MSAQDESLEERECDHGPCTPVSHASTRFHEIPKSFLYDRICFYHGIELARS